MAAIRVLVVDDAVVIRRLVSNALDRDPDVEVVGTASNGKIALARIPQYRPDIVILDVEMPEMDGLETVRQIRKDYRTLPVIMFSNVSRKGAEATIEALSYGANDYVTKPTSFGTAPMDIENSLQELKLKIKHYARAGSSALSDRAGRASSYVQPSRTALQLEKGKAAPLPQVVVKAIGRPKVVVVGVSTGGPDALQEFLSKLPAEFPLPVLIVQHMPPLFTKYLAERLDARVPLTVREAQDGDIARPGEILIAPGNFHMEVRKSAAGVHVVTTVDPPVNSCRPAVDVLFRSVADVYGGNVLAVVLTGMGSDGLQGTKLLKSLGATVIAQDQASSVVWGMPGAVAEAGLADSILGLSEIPKAVCELVGASGGLGRVC